MCVNSRKPKLPYFLKMSPCVSVNLLNATLEMSPCMVNDRQLHVYALMHAFMHTNGAITEDV